MIRLLKLLCPICDPLLMLYVLAGSFFWGGVSLFRVFTFVFGFTFVLGFLSLLFFSLVRLHKFLCVVVLVVLLLV